MAGIPAGDRRATERRGTHQASLNRLERKVDGLSERVDAYKLNGKAPALVLLADAATDLLKLAQASDQLVGLANAAPAIIAAVERDADWQTWWRMTKAILNPLRPLGAAIWVVLAGVISLVIYSHL